MLSTEYPELSETTVFFSMPKSLERVWSHRMRSMGYFVLISLLAATGFNMSLTSKLLHSDVA